MSTAEHLGAVSVDAKGKPIFVATEHRRYAPSVDRELTDQEKLAWKSFQLWRTAQSIERRDSVYKTLINSDFTNFNLAYHILGTPYPVVDDKNHIVDCMMGIRCMFRLAGYLPNDYECRKYGVMEDKERLEKKKEMWEKYAAYKREWCRRFDYHVYGIRPGENWNIFSACWFPSWEPSFNKNTDYPPRKNPHFLTTTPLRDKFIENPNLYEVPKDSKLPLIKARPEFKYIYRGPLEALANRKEE